MCWCCVLLSKVKTRRRGAEREKGGRDEKVRPPVLLRQRVPMCLRAYAVVCGLFSEVGCYWASTPGARTTALRRRRGSTPSLSAARGQSVVSLCSPLVRLRIPVPQAPPWQRVFLALEASRRVPPSSPPRSASRLRQGGRTDGHRGPNGRRRRVYSARGQAGKQADGQSGSQAEGQTQPRLCELLLLHLQGAVLAYRLK